MKHEPFLYKWTEISTGKWYIGSRTAKICHPDDGYICSSKIVKPLILANPGDWKREILCMGEAEYIRDLEIKYLHALDAKRAPMSYNGTNGAKSFVGGPMSQETRAKVSAVHKGKTVSQKTKAKQSAAKKGKKHGPMSQEQKDRLSATNKGRPKSPETRAKLSAAAKGKPSPNKGKTHSPETKAKMSATKKGMKYNKTKKEESVTGDLR